MRRLRRPATWLALFAICFVQLAAAAHACTVVSVPASHTPCAQMGMAMGDGDPPSGMCLEHCKGDSQLVDHQSPVPPGASPNAAPIVVAAAGEALLAASLPRVAPDPPIPLPVYAASSRLRI